MIKVQKKTKAKSKAWFVKVRGSYLPVSTAGWLTYIPFVGYLIFSLVAAVNDSRTKTLAVLYIVPNWMAAAIVMTYIAARKS